MNAKVKTIIKEIRDVIIVFGLLFLLLWWILK